jgi:hypothetical protein
LSDVFNAIQDFLDVNAHFKNFPKEKHPPNFIQKTPRNKKTFTSTSSKHLKIKTRQSVRQKIRSHFP